MTSTQASSRQVAVGSENVTTLASRSPGYQVRIEAQNRRREWLQQNPSYFDRVEHELADPNLYVRLVRPFQTAAEREAEARTKGFGLTLEADLARGEQRLSDLASPSSATETASLPHHGTNGSGARSHSRTEMTSDNSWDDVEPASREHGHRLWRAFLSERFIRGRDDDFSYSVVDEDWTLDVTATREAQDEWFDDEEPAWVDGGAEASRGETGIQDF
ncbi:hypothetical protein DCS_03994 [Drechmeria coniospora]|uniref:CCD97-like C-terminal domain-containing protein n=1 Tax=Drechmeria coniospora TaxID=98403 RepID=A0A151GIR1_DRECN|nr:hypothetical protein DCS_03994 [Drechmeria coniospora]KYK56987.1 hypothetical protein DCS_03994 [Drechmeria coniospora]ODA80462.1 hypothetical protein RJ55_03420 [Drechmeria coniospora]